MSVELSIVIPIYNMAAIVPNISKRLLPILSSITPNFEIVLVDDGSVRDASWQAIVDEAAAHPAIKGVKLSRNFGQQIAVSAGIASATGDYIIVMDGDLQNPPEAIPDILARLKAGDQIVYTVSRTRNNRRDEWTSRLFWFLLARLLKVDIIKNQLMMRGMTRHFARLYDGYPELTRTVAGITRDIGMQHSVLEVANQRREVGKSSYNFFRRFNLMLNMIISITTAPLNLLINVSIIVFLLTVAVSIWYVINWLVFDVQSGFTSIMLAIFFFGSLTTLILGIIGLYVANIYVEVRRRPLFVVEERTKLLE